ncbi:hypothetical protein M407DRAFT_20890 [Tulasnella calospora MUT 4182]|uniref:F-box domain-containing protein n=1 Tax=Tulasnella calospora MUT 4182 TaxID=1051891 RepID=A0A0C3L864_9AGAM|nr:hypothetical protein M407DRAFT_20890 [Tulasnella calospora MUT 4182]
MLYPVEQTYRRPRTRRESLASVRRGTWHTAINPKATGTTYCTGRPEAQHVRPINILPHGLLVTVFTIAVDSESHTVGCNNATLMLVCQCWNHLVNNTPSLWTKIWKTAMTSNASIIRALERSKDSSLEIESITSPLYIPPEDETAFLGTIFPHAHRWRKVTLWLREERFEPMASLSAFILESLSLSCCRDSGQPRDELLDIFGGRPQARLQELFLTEIAVPWSPTTFCNLKVLKIESIQHLGPSLDQLFAILSASPGLELLFIQYVSFWVALALPSQTRFICQLLENYRWGGFNYR